MKPRGPLMIEHRLIEKMLKAAGKELAIIKQNKEADPIFIDTVIDFIKIYADRTHHGKEEDILFKELEKKNMSSADAKIMRELIDEHSFARKTVAELVNAKKQYEQGKQSAFIIIVDRLKDLIHFYPAHIEKEDKIFFPDTEKYFSAAELEAMLAEFWEFDRKMIHEKYAKVVKELESR